MQTDPDIFRELLSQPEKFTKDNGLYDLAKEILGDGLVTSAGEAWRSQRKLITPLFHYGSLKKMMSPITKYAQHMTQVIESRQQEEIESTFIQEVTMKIIISAAFGEGFDSTWMAKAFHDLGLQTGYLFTWGFLVGVTLARMLPLPFNIQRRKLKAQVIQKVEALIAQRKEQLRCTYFHC